MLFSENHEKAELLNHKKVLLRHAVIPSNSVLFYNSYGDLSTVRPGPFFVNMTTTPSTKTKKCDQKNVIKLNINWTVTDMIDFEN